MRVATYNVRNGRAPDFSSFWWTRRRALVDAMVQVDADIWGLQEVYRFQRRYLERVGFPDGAWGSVGVGRAENGGGEQVPILYRRSRFEHLGDTTRWFGPSPDIAGSIMPGARQPRISSEVRLKTAHTAAPLRVLNLHLDSDSATRRAESVRQLVTWLEPVVEPTIVMGDFNGAMTEPGLDALREIGLRPALGADQGPTANGFGRHLDEQGQIDHVFVSADVVVSSARIAVEAGHASDHYPVVVDFELDVDPGIDV